MTDSSDVTALRERVAELEALLAKRNNDVLNERKRHNIYHVAIYDTLQGMLHAIDLETILHSIMSNSKYLVGTRHCFIYLIDETKDVLTLRVGLGVYSNHIGYSVRRGNGLVGHVWQTEQTMWNDRVANILLDEVCSEVGVPLRTGSGVVGVVGVSYLENNYIPNKDDIETISRFADLVAMALDHARLKSMVLYQENERCKIEDELKKSQQRFQSIVEKTPAGVCITNEQYIYEYVNPAYCRLYHYERHELEGQSFLKVVPAENHAFMKQLHDDFIRGASEIQGEWNVITHDGTELTILADAARITGDDGRPKKATFVIDITARKQAEQSLQRRNSYMSALHDITLGLVRRLDLNELLTTIVTQSGALVDTPNGYIYLIDTHASPEQQTMQLQVGIGVHADTADYTVIKGTGIAGIVWQTGETLVIDDYHTWEHRPVTFTESNLQAAVGVPLVADNQVIGVFGLTYTENNRYFGEYEVRILEQFAELASIALYNAQLYTQLQQELAERTRTEASLRLMAGAVHHSTECVLITDAQLEQPGPHIVYVNQAFSILTGYTQEDVLGKTPRILQGAKTNRVMLKQLSETLQRGEPFSAETVNYRKDGSEYYVEWQIAPIRNDAGEITHWVSVQHDTTERKRAEQKLTQLADILEATTDLVSTADTDGNTLYLNRAWKRLMGLDPECDVTTQTIPLFYPEWALQIIYGEGIPTAIAHGTWSGETAVLAANNREIPVSQVIIAHSNTDKHSTYISTIARDISERKAVERELRAAQQAAEAANYAKSMFLSRMSHELRTPLNAILGFVQLMERDNTLAANHRDHVGIIKRSGEHLLTLINDVLEISRIEAGQQQLNEQSYNLHASLHAIGAMFHARTVQRALTFHLDIVADVPQFVRGDEGKLRQILTNLLGNAIKFTEQGSITLRCWQDQQPQQQQRIHLWFVVSDTGKGIAPDEQHVLFQEFGQTQTGRDSQQGTGLGLAISRAFIRLMGGDIRVESVPMQGTTFTFDVWCAPADAATVEQQTAPPRRAVALPPGSPLYRILVVDDKWENRQFLSQLLQLLGFEVREAEHGNEAIATWQTWQPHLIWMDMRMPILDGYDATRAIRQLPHGDEPCIIALTASAFEHERGGMIAAGCNDVVLKPFKEETIITALEHHLAIQFIYEDITITDVTTRKQPSSPVQIDKTDTITTQEEDAAATMAMLSPDIQTTLRQAAVTLNAKRTREVIERIRNQYPLLANTLETAVKSYRFDTIISLLPPE